MRLESAIVLIFIALTVSTSPVHAVIRVGRNIDIAGEAAPDRQRVETTIAVDPRNPNIISAGAQDYRLVAIGGHHWDGYYRSTDGGVTWSSSLIPGFPGDTSPTGLSSPLHGLTSTTDPVLTFDGAGNAYYVGISTRFDLFVVKYANDGADFAGGRLICMICADKPWIAVDTSGGPNDGTVYVAFDGASGLEVVRSTDGGQTFSLPVVVSSSSQFPGVAVDPSGTVFVSSITTGGHTILVSKSSDGGLTFQRPVLAVIGVTPLPNPLPGNSFRTFTNTQIAADSAGVHVVWDDFGTGDSDVLTVRSLDGGATWSSPLRVNDVTTGQQFFPSIAISAGVISVIWYDSRLGQLPNGTITALDVFYARSTNVGATFSPSLRITSVSFNPNLVERTDGSTQPFMGDYIQVAASPTAVHPIWADNRNACDTVDPTFGCVDQDAFTATITL